MVTKSLVIVSRFASESARKRGVEKYYTVKRDSATGELSCDCPAWIYMKGSHRTCKHVRAVR
jgi:hypothetical protein